VALSHHERWDGTGYPSRLAGEAIPLSGRIVAVVDFFDALTMDRCYRPAFSDARARDAACRARRAFDPAWSTAFIDSIADMIELRDCVTRNRLDFEDCHAGRAVAHVPRDARLRAHDMNTAPCQNLPGVDRPWRCAQPLHMPAPCSTASRRRSRCACASGPTTTASPSATRAPSSWAASTSISRPSSGAT
jgi:hypothetical protein